MVEVNVARDFTRYPAGRYERNGATSGEAFRKHFLEGPLKRGEVVTVEFDGTIGYGSSFLEESFGGLVRALQMPSHDLIDKLVFVSSDTVLIDEVRQYMVEASRALGSK